MGELKIAELLPDLWRIDDTCAVYIVKDGNRAIAVDFGSGDWLPHLPSLGIAHLDHVLITHPHAGECAGLLAKRDWPFVLHVPAGPLEWPQPPWTGGGCPANYEPPKGPLPGAVPDLAGNCHFFWQGRRIRFIDTPGHTAHAVSVVIDHADRQIVFCGDAAHAGATIHEPFNLEWDHWTGSGALAAWEGIRRLIGVRIDLLCPSHGPVVAERACEVLPQNRRRRDRRVLPQRLQ
jgi:glyoxylase-like metal-dependent hydrolase (beta-lactamase superfamily II)